MNAQHKVCLRPMILKLATYEIRSGNRLSGYVAQVSFGEPDVAALFCDAVSP